MKKGTSVEFVWENHMERYDIVKKKGRLTLEEIQEALEKEGTEGYVAIILRVGDLFDGWSDESQIEGDSVTCYPISEGENCPVCQKISTLHMYCPSCGNFLKEVKE